MTIPWSRRYAQRTRCMGSSAIRELLKLTQQPDIISFAGGLPAPELFPLAELQAACQKVLQDQGAQALQYSTTEGYLPLRRWLAERMGRMGLAVTEANILITSGSQQALDLIAKLFINPGDHILVERPSYLGAMQAFNSYQAEYVSVGMDEDGLRTDLLAEALRDGVKLMYILPNFQNPSGITLSLERRQALVQTADRYGIPLVEDDPYGELRFEGEPLPLLLALDAERRGSPPTGDGLAHGHVIYTSTFSKTLAPGLRLGWVVAPAEVIRCLVMAKQGVDLHTATFTQMVAYEVARDGFLDRHIQKIRAVYRERRDHMVQAMARYFPPGVRWTRPQGGLFLWVTLPESIDAAEMLRDAIAEKVAYVPGAPFFADGGGKNTMRLNFSFSPPDVAEEGIRRLGRVIARRMAQASEPEAEAVIA
jgi:2-aminoadipate transaminase